MIQLSGGSLIILIFAILDDWEKITGYHLIGLWSRYQHQTLVTLPVIISLIKCIYKRIFTLLI